MAGPWVWRRSAPRRRTDPGMCPQASVECPLLAAAGQSLVQTPALSTLKRHRVAGEIVRRQPIGAQQILSSGGDVAIGGSFDRLRSSLHPAKVIARHDVVRGDNAEPAAGC